MAYVPTPVYTRNLRERYTIEASKCVKCGYLNFPSKGVCRKCGNAKSFTPAPLTGRGKVYSYTVIGAGSAPPEFSEQQKIVGAYTVAIVELDEGPKIIAQITDAPPGGLKIGTPVEAIFRKLYEDEGVTRYGFKFKCIQTRKASGRESNS